MVRQRGQVRPTDKDQAAMTIGINYGSVGVSTTVLKSYQDTHPHLKRIERVDHRGETPSTQLSPAEEAAAMRKTAEGRGNHASRVPRTALEAAGSAINFGDAKAISARLGRLEALVASQAEQIQELHAQVNTLLGETGEAA
jgi:hypothetical protein